MASNRRFLSLHNNSDSNWSPLTSGSTEARYARQLSEFEPYFYEENSENLSYSELESFPSFLINKAEQVLNLHFDHNIFKHLPSEIGAFANLVNLDISNNQINKISPEICKLSQLKTFIARNNCLNVESIPKDFSLIKSLIIINLSGNLFTEIPMQFTEITTLKSLYLGANHISTIPKEIGNLRSLEILYLGGNILKSIPVELGNMESLVSLVLSDNLLEQLPGSLSYLQNLQSLSLHNNRLSTLPPELIHINLQELSLRNNPLVVRFVQDLIYEPPSLMELAGRIIKIKNISYTSSDLPSHLIAYLDMGQQCVNPKCKGVFFSSHVEQIKFVDFCGKYRLPLLQYLCSPRCTSGVYSPYSSSESESEDDMLPAVSNRIKKVLLG